MKEGFNKENLANELWRYALDNYAKPEVAELCLALQLQFDQDVNILLTAGFASAKGLVWSTSTLTRLKNASAELRQDYILPLREMRKAAKNRSPSATYQALKDAELALEQWQLSILAAAMAEEYVERLGNNTEPAHHEDTEQGSSNILLCRISDNSAEHRQLLALAAALSL